MNEFTFLRISKINSFKCSNTTRSCSQTKTINHYPTVNWTWLIVNYNNEDTLLLTVHWHFHHGMGKTWKSNFIYGVSHFQLGNFQYLKLINSHRQKYFDFEDTLMPCIKPQWEYNWVSTRVWDILVSLGTASVDVLCLLTWMGRMLKLCHLIFIGLGTSEGWETTFIEEI